MSDSPNLPEKIQALIIGIERPGKHSPDLHDLAKDAEQLGIAMNSYQGTLWSIFGYSNPLGQRLLAAQKEMSEVILQAVFASRALEEKWGERDKQERRDKRIKHALYLLTKEDVTTEELTAQWLDVTVSAEIVRR